MTDDYPSAWNDLVREWVERERQAHPDAPIQGESVRVRDTIEIDDQAYVLVSYDVEHPWPAEEDAPGSSRDANTAVLQAMRVRAPWIEKDATRALGELRSDDGSIRVFEHLLGARRAFSGFVESPLQQVELHFSGGEDSHTATVVDGWFLAVVPDACQIVSITGTPSDGGEPVQIELHRQAVAALLSADDAFARSAGQSMYFSPLDLRSVHPLTRWQRGNGAVVVASCVEQYDEGGIIRLRIDGVRPDDDLFVNWPKVVIYRDGKPVASAVCGETAVADTLSIDVGFRPWTGSFDEFTVIVRGLRGIQGLEDPIELSLAQADSSR